MQPNLYEEVAMQIAEDLWKQRLSEEPMIPKDSSLMKRYRTNRATVRRALFLLVQKKLLLPQGEGFRINPDPLAWRKLAEKKVEQSAKALFQAARAFGLEDHRTVDIILRSVGQTPAQG